MDRIRGLDTRQCARKTVLFGGFNIERDQLDGAPAHKRADSAVDWDVVDRSWLDE